MYYQDIFIKWKKYFLSIPSLPSFVASQCLWHIKYMKIDDKAIFSSSLSAKGINFAGQPFQNNQQIKKCDELTKNSQKISCCSDHSCSP